jgi:RNA polymerase sigma-70 factor (ECF subfamily)
MARTQTALAVVHTRPNARESGAPDSMLARLRSGDEEAFEELVRREQGHLLAVARRILRDDDEARDAVQEALLAAYRALPYYQGEARLSTWLHRIAVNAALMRLRSRRRRREDLMDDIGASDVPPADWAVVEDDVCERTEMRALVRGCIARLPERYRQVIVLRDLEERDTQETADALGIGADAVKMRLHRARAALRAMLAPHVA